MSKHARDNEAVREAAMAYDAAATRGETSPIYHFGKDVLEGDDLVLSDQSIRVPGFEQTVDLDLPNPYADMT